MGSGLDGEALVAATLLPLADTAVESGASLENDSEALSDTAMIETEGDFITGQSKSEEELTALSLSSPAVANTIPLPATTSAVVLNNEEATDIILVAANDNSSSSATQPFANDSDGDGVINSVDECDTRRGYPVNAKGCQALDGILKNVSFDADTDELTGSARGSLDNVARVLRDYPATRIAIMSYTSDTGSLEESRGQARDRARSVVSYLINSGVEGSRLEAYAFGHLNDSQDRIVIKEVD